jgi:7-keto-8-aminopelargonate synthetase-like enzyme
MHQKELGPPMRLIDPVRAWVGGRTLLYFGGCDYLRVSWEPRIRRALARGAERWGVNVAASRRTTGNRRLYEQLEQELADYFGVESAVLVSSGYVTDLVVGQGLAGRVTEAFIDARAHAALVDATMFLGCRVTRFEHRAARDLARRVRRTGRSSRPLVLTDGMFAHDGSVAPLRAYACVLPRNGWMLVDDAHGAGVLGEHGRGSVELEEVEDARLIRTITLSKAFGVYGGAILGSAEVRAMVLERSRLFVGNTPLPPPLAQAALAAVRLVRSRPGLRRRLVRNTQFLREFIRRGGVELADHPGPVLGIRPQGGGSDAVIDRALRDRGILPPFMVYGGGAEGGYYRFAISSAHRREHLAAVGEALLSCRERWESREPRSGQTR